MAQLNKRPRIETQNLYSQDDWGWGVGGGLYKIYAKLQRKPLPVHPSPLAWVFPSSHYHQCWFLCEHNCAFVLELAHLTTLQPEIPWPGAQGGALPSEL